MKAGPETQSTHEEQPQTASKKATLTLKEAQAKFGNTFLASNVRLEAAHIAYQKKRKSSEDD